MAVAVDGTGVAVAGNGVGVAVELGTSVGVAEALIVLTCPKSEKVVATLELYARCVTGFLFKRPSESTH